MKVKQIVFTRLNTAELIDAETNAVGDNDVMVKTAVSSISSGTEKANITGNLSVAGIAPPEKEAHFPRASGYNSAGTVVEVGKNVTHVKIGDRVVVYWGLHRSYNVVPARQVVKIEDDNISFNIGAVCFIGTFPLAAVRKTRVEFGESALVMGQGLLGQLAVMFMRASGAAPIIAADLVPERRARARELGADYALDPREEGFAAKVKELTHGGVNTCVEVTGVGAGLDGALDCMAKYGRIALLGCTRDPNFTIDYYRKIHCPGIELIGAHTMARPDHESHPGYFTHVDDIKAIMKMHSLGRVDMSKILAEVHKPEECTEVYTRLVNDPNFPTVTQFDWEKY